MASKTVTKQKTSKAKVTTTGLSPAPWARSPKVYLLFAAMLGLTGAAIIFFAKAATSTVTLNPSADTYVSSKYLVSHGANTSMKVSGPSSDSLRETYVKFNVSGVANVANNVSITSAKLRLYVVTGTGSSASIYSSAKTNWSETMLYGQQPGVTGGALASPAVSAGAWVEVSLPVGLIKSDGVYSFTIKTSATNGVEYATRESSHKPQLILTTVSNSTAQTTSNNAPGTEKAGYKLLWNDEFNGTALDATKWNVYTGTLDYDQACYRKESVSVSGGNLVIQSAKNTGVCGNAYSKWTKTNTARPYTSGYVRTDATGSNATKYTVRPDSAASKVIRIEYRAQMPKNIKGLWPGLWSRNTQGSTYYGELDLLERFGDPRNAYSYDVTTHVGSGHHTGGDTGSVSNWTCPSTALKMNCNYNVETGMNVYAVEVDLPKSEVRYYINDQLIVRHNASSSPGFDKATWDRAMNDPWDLRLMNQIVDPNDPYHAEPDSSFVASDLKVDYARVYAKL